MRLFKRQIDETLAELDRQLQRSVHIAVIGKVSSGKSSLINALLQRDRDGMAAEVGAVSGVTTELKVIRLDERVVIIDSPGLDDIRSENSEITEAFLRSVDIGVFVVTGSADATQRRLFDDLRRTCDATFVVLNKADEWDRHHPTTRQRVIDQWSNALGVDRVFPTCAFGYDPDVDRSVPLDIRGVDELQDAVEVFLAERGKDLLLARHVQRMARVSQIVSDALRVAASLPVISGSPAAAVVSQVYAISALHFLYTGRTLGKAPALSVLSASARNAPLITLLLWLPPMIPLWLLLGSVARRLRSSLVFSLLAAVQGALAAGEPLDREHIDRRFRVARHLVKRRIASSPPKAWKSPDFWTSALGDLGRRLPAP